MGNSLLEATGGKPVEEKKPEVETSVKEAGESNEVSKEVLDKVGISDDILAEAVLNMDKRLNKAAGSAEEVLQPEFMNELKSGMADYTNGLTDLVQAVKEDGGDIVTVAEVEANRAQPQTLTVNPKEEAPINENGPGPLKEEEKKASFLIVEENKNRLATKLAAAKSDVTEKLALRRKKGRSTTGYMYSSNLMLKVYNMDTPLKKRELEIAYEYFQSTTFTARKTLKELYDFTSVMTADGETMTFDQFLEIMSIDDLDDYLAIAMASSTVDGTMKKFPVNCISKKHPECGNTFEIDINIAEIMETAAKPDFFDRKSRYDRTKTSAELSKDSVSAIELKAEYHDTNRDERVDIKMSSPNFKKYFEISDIIKASIIRELLDKEHIMRFIMDKAQDRFKYITVDDKLSFFAENFPAEYGEQVILHAHLYYIDGITIYPMEYINRAATLTPEEEKELESTIIKLDTLNEFNISTYLELLKDLPDDVFDTIDAETSKLSEGKREAYKVTYTCPKCKDTMTGEISMYDIFFVWVSSSNESKK